MSKKIFVILTICFGAIAVLFAFLGFAWDNSWIVMLIFGILIGITWIVYAILKKKGKIESSLNTKIINGITPNFNWVFNVEDNPNSFAEKQFKSSNAFHKFIRDLEMILPRISDEKDLDLAFLSCRKVLEWLLTYVRNTDEHLTNEYIYFVNIPNGKCEIKLNYKLKTLDLKTQHVWKLESSSINQFKYVCECYGKKLEFITSKQLTNFQFRLIEQSLAGKPLIRKWQLVNSNDKDIAHDCELANNMWMICSDALHFESNFEYKLNKHFNKMNIDKDAPKKDKKFMLLVDQVYSLRELMFDIACIYCGYNKELSPLDASYYYGE